MKEMLDEMSSFIFSEKKKKKKNCKVKIKENRMMSAAVVIGTLKVKCNYYWY